MREPENILRDISVFRPVNDEWLALDDLIEELWSVGVQPEHLPTLLGVFERYPEDDGAGVFWSIVHGIESLPVDYEPVLIESINRNPSLMGNIMLKRLRKEQAG